MKYFCKFIVISEEEFNSSDSICEFVYDDYRYWGLFSFDDDTILFLEDNIHRIGIEDEIDAFLDGVKFAGEEISVTSGAIVLKDISRGVSHKDVLLKLLERDIVGGSL